MIRPNSAASAARRRFLLSIRRNAIEPSKSPVVLPWHVKFLLAYLAAITIIGKGPTYLGVPPLYWGEATMIVGLLLIAPRVKGTDFLHNTRPLSIVIVTFMALGGVLTTMSLPQWRLDAVRDAAMWYYALFYFIGLGLASQNSVANRVWSLLRDFWILALIWNTADLLSNYRLSHSGPLIPGRGVTLFFNATHEAGQNLGLGSLIVLCTSTLNRRTGLRAILVPVALVGLAVFAAANGRGMRVGIASGILVVLLLSLAPNGMPHFDTRLLKLTVAAVPLLAVAAVAMPERALKLANLDRFAEATGALKSEPNSARPEGTAGWRLLWWQHIYQEVMRRNPVFGLGFGQSLHVYNPLLGFASDDKFIIRSPHNFNVTVFARMGISGLLIWWTIVAIGIGSLFRKVWRGSIGCVTYTAARRDELTFWILMLVCTVVNSSMGVLMEGPALGVWFWFALGFATGRSLSSGADISRRSSVFRLRARISRPVPAGFCGEAAR